MTGMRSDGGGDIRAQIDRPGSDLIQVYTVFFCQVLQQSSRIGGSTAEARPMGDVFFDMDMKWWLRAKGVAKSAKSLPEQIAFVVRNALSKGPADLKGKVICWRNVQNIGQIKRREMALQFVPPIRSLNPG